MTGQTVLTATTFGGGPAETAAVATSAGVDTVGGTTPVALAAIAAFFVAVALSVLVTYRFVAGYRRTRRRPLLLLAVGMLLLAPAPMFLRLVLGNVALVGPEVRSLVTTLSELIGLLVILTVVYRS